MKTIISIGLGLLLLVSCKGLDTNEAVSGEKMTDLIESGNYQITLNFANPLATNDLNRLGLLAPGNTGSRIDIRGNVSYIELKGDSLDVQLPYYGTRHSGITTNNNRGGIEFQGQPKNYTTSFNEKKQRTIIRFEMKERSELYDVSIEVFPSSSVYVSINSTQRSSISYDGVISELEEK